MDSLCCVRSWYHSFTFPIFYIVALTTVSLVSESRSHFTRTERRDKEKEIKLVNTRVGMKETQR